MIVCCFRKIIRIKTTSTNRPFLSRDYYNTTFIILRSQQSNISQTNTNHFQQLSEDDRLLLHTRPLKTVTQNSYNTIQLNDNLQKKLMLPLSTTHKINEKSCTIGLVVRLAHRSQNRILPNWPCHAGGGGFVTGDAESEKWLFWQVQLDWMKGIACEMRRVFSMWHVVF